MAGQEPQELAREFSVSRQLRPDITRPGLALFLGVAGQTLPSRLTRLTTMWMWS
jgi:hypothetical protein